MSTAQLRVFSRPRDIGLRPVSLCIEPIDFIRTYSVRPILTVYIRRSLTNARSMRIDEKLRRFRALSILPNRVEG